MKIEKIKKLSNGKYKIQLENKEVITTYDEVILNENILFKKEIDNELLNKINNQNDYYKIYNKTLKYIMTKIRSEKEINIYLDKQNVEKIDKEKIIKKLKDNNMLNDKTYLKAFIADKVRLSSDGKEKIKKQLLEQDIDSKLIDEELEKYDEEIKEKLEKLINKKIKTYYKYSEYIAKQKIKEYFINLGYKIDEIDEVLNKIKIENTDSIKKEYEKQYNKLSKKYKDKELEYKLKNTLYQKGYKIDEINKIM